MKDQSYSATLEVALSPKDVFTRMNDFKKWWTSHIDGQGAKLTDEFILRYGDAQGDIHYSKHNLVELIPDKKIVSLVTESKLNWIEKDKNEWTHTKLVFELTPKGDRTELTFTHEGLLPEKECYAECAKGWDTFIKQNLYAYLSEGKVLSNDFKSSVAAKISADEAIKRISHVPAWWGITFTGSAENQNDRFIVKMGGDSFFNFTVAELTPGKRVVWLVTDCHMPWYSDKKEWANTRLIFDLTENNGITNLNFKHEGLTPEVECYKDCEPGWTHWINTSLFSYLTTGKGDFNRPYKMKQQSYTATIAIAHSPRDVFDRLKDVSKWWSGEDFEGRSAKLDDEFTIRHGDAHYSKQKLVEVIPDRKIVWLVTESRLTWLERDQDEWTNTKMIFEITPKGDMTELNFTHEGLVPEKECYSRCIQGWDTVIKVAFAKAMVTEGRSD